jgi:hypothetical protein
MTASGQSRHYGYVQVTSGYPQLRTWPCTAITDAMCQPRKSRPHSITSVALVSKVWGTVRPNAFAVLRLTTSS